MTPLAGKLADITCIPAVLSASSLVPLLTVPLILAFPGANASNG